jgi:hypothetical protein
MTHRSITALLDARRLAGLETTPGGRIVAKVSAPDAKGTAYRSSLVEILEGSLLPLTRGSASVGSAALAEDGTTLFTAKRVGEDGEEADDAQLWALPPRGEAREIASRPGGFGGLHLADGALVAEIDVHSLARDEAEHARLSGERTKAEVSAALHDGFPTRYWDHDLGPARSVLAVATLPEDLFSAEATLPSGADGATADVEAARRARPTGPSSLHRPSISRRPTSRRRPMATTPRAARCCTSGTWPCRPGG